MVYITLCPTWNSNLEWTRYRESLKCAQRAGKHFQAENVDLVLQLGDILDGKSGDNVKRDLLERVLPALKCTTKRNFDGSECSEYGSIGSGVFSFPCSISSNQFWTCTNYFVHVQNVLEL